MKIFGSELFLGATLKGKCLSNNETVYGFSVIPVSEDKAFLIMGFNNEVDIKNGCFVYYMAVDPDSISIIDNKAPLYQEGNSFDSSLAFIRSEELGKKKYSDFDKEFVGLTTGGIEVRGVAYFKVDSLCSIIIEDFNYKDDDERVLISKYSVCLTNSVRLVDKNNIKLVKER